MRTLLLHIALLTCANVAFSQVQDPAENFAKAKLSTLTLDQKLGQLFMIRAHSNKGTDHIRNVEQQIKNYHVGGLCFFQGTPSKQAELTNRYQRLSDIPLMVAIDAEWGLGMRHKKDALSFPKQLTLGAIKDNTLIYDMGTAVAEQLSRIGVHVNFAPVVDVNNNAANPVIHNRSFGEDMYNVATKAYAYTKGMQDAGLMACAKHFPGHGDTDKDSHFDLPVISHHRDRLDSLELMPFRVLTQLGIQSMMTAHLSINALEQRENRPTSLSKKVVTDLLQDQMHFEGLIFTDGLEMEGVAKYFSPGDMEYEAIKAGNDIMLLPIDIGKAVTKLKDEINNQRLDISVIDNKVLKILKAKYHLGLTGQAIVKNLSTIPADVNKLSHKRLKRKLYEKSLTLAKDDDNQIPIKRIDHRNIAVLSIGSSGLTTFQKTLQQFGIKRFVNVGKVISPDRVKNIISQLKSYEHVIISLHDMSISATKDYGLTKSQFDLIYALHGSRKVTLVNFGTPYALKYFHMIPSIVQAYEEDDIMQDVCAQSMLGVSRIEGILPVTVHRNLKSKSGIIRPSLHRLGYSSPEMVNINPDTLLKIDTIVQEMLDKRAAPGCQVLASKNGRIFFNKAYGYHTDRQKNKVSTSDIYDVASVTKILTTTISLMKMEDENQLNINYPLEKYLNQLTTTNKGPLIIEDVLAHQSGLPGWIPFYKETMDSTSTQPKRLDKYYQISESDEYPYEVCEDLFLRKDLKDTIYSYIYNCDLKERRKYRYSDLGFYLFQQLIESVSGLTLDSYAWKYFYNPLGLENTLFNPLRKFDINKITPSEKDEYFRLRNVHGYVHDMGAAMLGGVAGHAGLFSNSYDLAVLMQMLLNGGSYAGTQYLKPETVSKFTKRYHKSTRRGLGFDMKELDDSKTENVAAETSEKAFGHLGFTGISVWADPEHDLIYIFLSNRTYPTMENKIFSKKNYRPRIQSVLYRAIEE